MIIFYFLPERFFATSLKDYSYCLHKQIFGVGCPGCGMMRATYYFLHMNYKKALGLNANVVFVFPIIIGEISYQVKRIELLRKLNYVIYICFCISLLTLYLTRIFNH
jgi:hypothetical protein